MLMPFWIFLSVRMIQEKNISGQREEASGINIILGGKNTWEAPRTVKRECYNDFELVR
jgi:hypothetical protein